MGKRATGLFIASAQTQVSVILIQLKEETSVHGQKSRGLTQLSPKMPVPSSPGVSLHAPSPLLLSSTFEKPSSLTGQTPGTYLYAAQISESVLSLCRVKNGLHFLDSPCGCKE